MLTLFVAVVPIISGIAVSMQCELLHTLHLHHALQCLSTYWLHIYDQSFFHQSRTNHHQLARYAITTNHVMKPSLWTKEYNFSTQ